jgi:hypothetical protein
LPLRLIAPDRQVRVELEKCTNEQEKQRHPLQEIGWLASERKSRSQMRDY